ncbi:preprotein translocase subunit SecY [Clostridium bornimense]|uniref:preprotein translocase subunit SecY n=1 Tax=Clostridium bornimense TaxID=1216932 RepID=UPI001C0FF1BE|nr:preprotein translocase subunit SecY [Clostridium bornimense]MBU5315928.1 preprotein translocase subunit SecY [Clostridium bornimense]
MFKTLRNAWNVAELRKRIIYTFLILVIYRLGNHIIVPFVDTSDIVKSMSQQGGLLSFVDMMNGGALSKLSVFALGVMPYIEASIIMQLLTVAIPRLESISKEGEEGRKKINKYTRYLSIVFSIIMGIGTYAIMTRYGASVSSNFEKALVVLSLMAGSTFTMWLGDQITAKGIGNGMSLLIAWNILSRVPSMIGQVSEIIKTGNASLIEAIVLVGVLAVLLVGVIAASLSERRVPIQYASKSNGRVFNQSSNIPFGLTSSVVIAIIFAMSVVQFPAVIAQINTNWGYSKWVLKSQWSPFNTNTVWYVILFVLAIMFFTWFYTQITFKPDEMAENIHKSSGFIPGVRPGEPTERYLTSVLNRVSVISGIIASIVSVIPIIMEKFGSFQVSITGTALLIVIGVSVEIVKTLESQLVMRNYEGFLKKN